MSPVLSSLLWRNTRVPWMLGTLATSLLFVGLAPLEFQPLEGSAWPLAYWLLALLLGARSFHLRGPDEQQLRELGLGAWWSASARILFGVSLLLATLLILSLLGRVLEDLAESYDFLPLARFGLSWDITLEVVSHAVLLLLLSAWCTGTLDRDIDRRAAPLFVLFSCFGWAALLELAPDGAAEPGLAVQLLLVAGLMVPLAISVARLHRRSGPRCSGRSRLRSSGERGVERHEAIGRLLVFGVPHVAWSTSNLVRYGGAWGLFALLPVLWFCEYLHSRFVFLGRPQGVVSWLLAASGLRCLIFGGASLRSRSSPRQLRQPRLLWRNAVLPAQLYWLAPLLMASAGLLFVREVLPPLRTPIENPSPSLAIELGGEAVRCEPAATLREPSAGLVFHMERTRRPAEQMLRVEGIDLDSPFRLSELKAAVDAAWADDTAVSHYLDDRILRPYLGPGRGMAKRVFERPPHLDWRRVDALVAPDTRCSVRMLGMPAQVTEVVVRYLVQTGEVLEITPISLEPVAAGSASLDPLRRSGLAKAAFETLAFELRNRVLDQRVRWWRLRALRQFRGELEELRESAIAPELGSFDEEWQLLQDVRGHAATAVRDSSPALLPFVWRAAATEPTAEQLLEHIARDDECAILVAGLNRVSGTGPALLAAHSRQRPSAKAELSPGDIAVTTLWSLARVDEERATRLLRRLYEEPFPRILIPLYAVATGSTEGIDLGRRDRYRLPVLAHALPRFLTPRQYTEWLAVACEMTSSAETFAYFAMRR